MNKRNIMLVANQSYLIPMFTMLSSLFDNNPYPIDIYLFSSDFTDEMFQMAEKFCECWSEKRLIGHLLLGEDEGTDIPVSDRFPVEVYYKILGLKYIPEELSNILVMDLDMVVKSSLEDVFEINLDGYALAACKDLYGYVYGEAQRNHERLEIASDYTYFNAGFMCYNLDYIRQQGGADWLMQEASEHADLLKWPEQDLLNILFKNKCLILDWHQYNCPPVMYVMNGAEVQQGILRPLYRDELQQMSDFTGYMDYTQAIYEQAAVIHYIGETKPWDAKRMQAGTFDIFDQAYLKYSDRAAQIIEQCREDDVPEQQQNLHPIEVMNIALI